jgi:signal transduction histidine kinase
VALTQRVLGFARQEPIDPRQVDANEVISRTLEMPWRAGSKIVTDVRLQRDLWPVFVDPDQLGNALLNLAINAQDAMESGGKLTIQTVNCPLADLRAADQAAGLKPGDYVGIFVGDTGHGMSKEVRDQAFDPFFTTKGPEKGTGLGLSQVYGLCTRSGGGCAIDSEPGRGTTIRLYLPRCEELGPGLVTAGFSGLVGVRDDRGDAARARLFTPPD